MSKIFKVRRGNEADRPVLALGEFGLDLDKNQLWIGGLSGNFLVNKKDYVNVVAFGADPTGATDSTQAIEDARDYVDTNGGILYFPSGDYLVSSAIEFNKPITLLGDGNANVGDVNNKTRITLSGGNTKLYYNSTGGTSEYGFEMIGIQVFGNQSANVGLEIASNSARNIIERCSFVSCIQYGVILASDNGDVFSECIFQSNGATQPHYAGIKLKSCNIPRFNNCYFIWNGSGVYATDAEGGSYQPTFVNCDFEGNYYHGINIDSTHGSGIQYGTVKNCTFELNNVALASNIRDINLLGTNSSRWTIEDVRFSDLTANCEYEVYCEGWYLTLKNLASNGGNGSFFEAALRSFIYGAVELSTDMTFPLNESIQCKGYKVSANDEYRVNGDGSTVLFTIPHGLWGQPKVFNLTPSTADARIPFSVSADDTNIYVSFETAPITGSGGNVGLWWYVEM